MIEKDKYKSLTITLLLHLIALLLLMWLGFEPSPPPFPEPDGIMISFGDAPTGEGEIEKPASPAKMVSQQEEQPSETLTQDDEEAPAIEKTTKPKKQPPKPQKQQQPEPAKTTTEQINQNALFPSNYKATNARSASSGQTGGVGNQGTSDGSKNSNSPIGKGKGTSGISYSLGNRRVNGTLPQPHYPPGNIEGTVVVRIKVDRNGNVISATAPAKGSTTANLALVRAAIKAAYQAKFSKDIESIEQVGTITYRFKLH